MQNPKEPSKETKDITQAVTSMSISSNKKVFESFTVKANGAVYNCIGRTGKGSFGTVYKAQVGDDVNKIVAIKKVLQDPNYKVHF